MAIHPMESHQPSIHPVIQQTFPFSFGYSSSRHYCARFPLARHATPITFTRFLEDTLDTTHMPTKIPVARHSDNRVCRSGANVRLYGRSEHRVRSGSHS